MYPLLVTGLTSVAGNLLDSWNHAAERKAAAAAAPAAGQAQFQDLMGKAEAVPGGTARLAKQVRLEQLRKTLLNSPELKMAMETSDPAKQLALEVSAEGAVSLTGADGRTMRMQLSPETQAVAREYAAAIGVK